MEDESNLSSTWTGLWKYGYTVPVFIFSIVLAIGALTDARSLPLLIPIVMVNGMLLWFAVPLKWVRLVGSEFVISDGQQSCRVPASSLARVRAYRWMRAPTIYLFFDPPTRFAKKVSTIPPLSLGGSRFERIERKLQAIADRNAQPGATDNPGDAQRLREDH